jgi:hypothetical protein
VETARHDAKRLASRALQRVMLTSCAALARADDINSLLLDNLARQWRRLGDTSEEHAARIARASAPGK